MIPPAVTEREKAPFKMCFSSKQQVKSSVTASLDENSGLIHDSCTLVENFLKSLPDGGIISNNIKHMLQSNLQLMFSTSLSPTGSDQSFRVELNLSHVT